MYHSVPDVGDVAGSLPVPVADFRRQVESLLELDAKILGLTQALAHKATAPHQLVVAMTFDDGYADVMNAAAVLEEYGGRGTAYVCPGSLAASRRRPAGPAGRSGNLSVRELGELRKRGFEIGSHSMTHRPLDILRSAEIGFEVERSKLELEQAIGSDVSSFCYPHGYSSPRVRRAVAAAGYTNACVVARRLATIGGDRYAIPRVQARAGETGRDFIKRVRKGESGPLPRLKLAGAPVWRWVRLAVHRSTGHMLR
jgi:peptidoglycan/xylan/chitin deacetylase (PgdA/CDA1 family)